MLRLPSEHVNSDAKRIIADFGRHYYDGRVHVISEFDGVRLLTNESCEFLHTVSGTNLIF